MNLRCPGALTRKGIGTGGGQERWDLVGFESVCVFLFFVCCAEQGQGSSSLVLCPNQEAEEMMSAVYSRGKFILSACGLVARIYCREIWAEERLRRLASGRGREVGGAIDRWEHKPQRCSALRFAVHLELLGGWGLIQREMFFYCCR